ARVDAANARVARVGDVEPPGAVDRDVIGIVKLRVQCRAAVAGEAERAVAGDGRDRTVDVDAADALIERVGDVNAALRIDRDAERIRELRARCLPAVAAEAERPRTGDRRDRAGADPAHALV